MQPLQIVDTINAKQLIDAGKVNIMGIRGQKPENDEQGHLIEALQITF
jgi:hypothetical protein